MNVKKPLLVAAIAGTIGLAGLAGATAVSAESSDQGSIIDRIATKFNLNKDEVKAVFDEEKAARMAEHQAELSEKLEQAVTDGKITTEQKSLIENKLKELAASREGEMKALDEWATQNNIDQKYGMIGKIRGGDDLLQEAVDNGELTAEQKSLIEAKQSELQTKREASRDALEAWADDNGIDMQYLRGGDRIKVVRPF